MAVERGGGPRMFEVVCVACGMAESERVCVSVCVCGPSPWLQTCECCRRHIEIFIS